MLVEYEGCSETNAKVREALAGLEIGKELVEVKKKQNGGGKEVVAACQSAEIPTERFRVIGVYTNQCVQATVAGLIECCPEACIEVVRRACWPVEYQHWLRFANTKRVLLLPPRIELQYSR